MSFALPLVRISRKVGRLVPERLAVTLIYIVLLPAWSVSGMFLWGFGYWAFIAMNPQGDYERLRINCLRISAIAGPIVTANVLLLLLWDMYQNGLEGFGWISPFRKWSGAAVG